MLHFRTEKERQEGLVDLWEAHGVEGRGRRGWAGGGGGLDQVDMMVVFHRDH